jgi:hypothetical protein
MYIAGSVHDTDHPGFSNIFLVNTRNKMALRYNDISVLENHHVALAFDIMHHSQDMRVFDPLSPEDFKKARDLIINMVLGTDMSKHFSSLDYLNTRQNSMDFNLQEKDKAHMMNFMIHLSDISNPSKPWHLCRKWT